MDWIGNWFGWYYRHKCRNKKTFYDRSACISKNLKTDSITKITTVLKRRCAQSSYLPIKLFIGKADLTGTNVWCFLNEQYTENIIILFKADTGFLISFWHITRDQKSEIQNYGELHIDDL